MKKMMLLAILAIGSFPASAAVFEWVDDAGVINFTDNADNIPQKYRKRAREKDLSEQKNISVIPESGRTEMSSPGGSSAETYGGHGQAWWRSNFRMLHREISAITDELPGKRKELEALHHKRLSFQKPSDRIAYNQMKSEIEKTEARLSELQDQLSKFEEEASLAGVPMEWRK